MASLRGIQTRLRNYRSAEVAGGRALVFLTPPSHLTLPLDEIDPASEPLALLESADANFEVANHEKWLMLSQGVAQDEGLASSFVSIRLLAKVLLQDLDNEIETIRLLKAKEWENQRVAGLVRKLTSYNTG